MSAYTRTSKQWRFLEFLELARVSWMPNTDDITESGEHTRTPIKSKSGIVYKALY